MNILPNDDWMRNFAQDVQQSFSYFVESDTTNPKNEKPNIVLVLPDLLSVNGKGQNKTQLHTSTPCLMICDSLLSIACLCLFA